MNTHNKKEQKKDWWERKEKLIPAKYRTKPADKPAHTPGPWVLSGLKGISVMRRENGLRICTLNTDESKIAEDERQANAKLIADAPETAAERDRLREQVNELLAALKEERSVGAILKQQREQLLTAAKGSFDVLRREGPKGFDSAAERLSAAIAKAEGKQ